MDFEQTEKQLSNMLVEPDLKFTSLLESSLRDVPSRLAVLGYLSARLSTGEEHEETIIPYTIRTIEFFIGALQGSEHVENSPMIGIMKLLVSAPICPAHKSFIALTKYFAKLEQNPEKQMELFLKLQTVEVLLRNNDFDNAGIMSARLDGDIIHLNRANRYVYELQQASLWHARNDLWHEYKLRLELIYSCLDVQDPDAAMYSILHWINCLPRQKNPELRMGLLFNLFAKNDGKVPLLTVQLLYNLFALEDRLLKPPEKMHMVKKIFESDISLLNVQQVQAVYFFAGYYSSGMQSRFNDSILYYQYSNYFIYKSWQYLRDISSYLRAELEPEMLISALAKIELQLVEFTNQISLQNNAYVETLQAEYTKIDELYKKVEELSLTDTLTGLHNRRYMEDNLPQLALLSARHGTSISFAMIDIDHFKPINDTYGHLAGDYILQQIGVMIKAHFRKSDIVVRYGGEEFFIALYDMPKEHVLANFESLREKVEKHEFVFRQHRIPLSISIGISSWTFPTNAPIVVPEVIAKTDAALYQAKKTGRNRVCVG